MKNEEYDRERALRRATNVANELAAILRKDPILFRQISARAKRWIKKQDILERERIDAKDEAIRYIKLRKKALSKLTALDREILSIETEEDIKRNNKFSN